MSKRIKDRKAFFKQVANEIKEFRKNKTAWSELKRERREWDVTLQEGLTDKQKPYIATNKQSNEDVILCHLKMYRWQHESSIQRYWKSKNDINKTVWKELKRERREWDITLTDGLGTADTWDDRE